MKWPSVTIAPDEVESDGRRDLEAYAVLTFLIMHGDGQAVRLALIKSGLELDDRSLQEALAKLKTVGAIDLAVGATEVCPRLTFADIMHKDFMKLLRS